MALQIGGLLLMLLKNENQIIRVLKSHGDKALVIDCIKRTMPKWVDGDSLSNYDDCGEDEMFERTDYPFGRELTPKEERIAQERFTMIAGVLPFIGNEQKRNQMMDMLSEHCSKQTLRKYLCSYLVYQDIDALAPPPKAEKELTQDEKNMRWALNKFFYTKQKNSLMTAYTLMLKEKYCADTEHGSIQVITEEHTIVIVVFFLTVIKNGIVVLFLQIFASRYQEARCTTGRVTNGIFGFRVKQFHHHADNMTGSTELTVHASGGQFGKQMFIHITLGIGVHVLCHVQIDIIQGINNLGQELRSGDFENRITHIPRIGAFLAAMEILDKGENLGLHKLIHLFSREVTEYRPFVLVVSLKDAGIRQLQHHTAFSFLCIRFVQVVNKHKIGHLLDHIQGICNTACPEHFPEGIYLVF